MTFSSTARNAVQKTLKALADHFNVFATDLPPAPIRKEMEEEGWKFGVLHHPYRASLTMEFAITPEGRPALGIQASEADRQRLKSTIALKQGLLAP